jgi:F-type H+-transporting ATPase subunit gamma
MKELKYRIKSVKTTRKITKAMQLVATSRLRRAREIYAIGHEYTEAISQIVNSLPTQAKESIPQLIAGTGQDSSHLIIVCTSNKGLCGAFNGAIIRYANKEIQQLLATGKKVSVYAIGRRGYDYFIQSKQEINLLKSKTDITHHGIIDYHLVDSVACDILDLFESGQFDVCNLYYGISQSVLVQLPTKKQLIPFTPVIEKVIDYEMDSSINEILDDLARRNFSTQLFDCLHQCMISEQAARMTAMDNASRNSEQLLKKLEQAYNRNRQQHITNELIEIIAGSEAI